MTLQYLSIVFLDQSDALFSLLHNKENNSSAASSIHVRKMFKALSVFSSGAATTQI